MASLMLVISASAQLSRLGSLQGAVSAGIARASMHGIGGSSGDSVKIDVRKTRKAGNKPLSLSLPPGSILHCGGDAQSMVVASVKGEMAGGNSYSPGSDIYLPDFNTHSYVVEAYCINFDKNNPSSDTSFSLRHPDSMLARVVSEAARRGLSVRATQAAIWIVTDGVSYDHMSSKFPVSSSDWAQARAVVKHCRNMR